MKYEKPKIIDIYFSVNRGKADCQNGDCPVRELQQGCSLGTCPTCSLPAAMHELPCCNTGDVAFDCCLAGNGVGSGCKTGMTNIRE